LIKGGAIYKTHFLFTSCHMDDVDRVLEIAVAASMVIGIFGVLVIFSYLPPEVEMLSVILLLLR
jgi:hypothetical protein